MTKSPNVDSKRHRQARNCMVCDNGDWLCHRGCCEERTRAASNRRWRQEIEFYPEGYSKDSNVLIKQAARLIDEGAEQIKKVEEYLNISYSKR